MTHCDFKLIGFWF